MRHTVSNTHPSLQAARGKRISPRNRYRFEVRKRWKLPILFITVEGGEVQRVAPRNFWSWTKKAREHHVKRIAYGAEFFCDGAPSGRRQFIDP